MLICGELVGVPRTFERALVVSVLWDLGFQTGRRELRTYHWGGLYIGYVMPERKEMPVTEKFACPVRKSFLYCAVLRRAVGGFIFCLSSHQPFHVDTVLLGCFWQDV